MAHPAHDDVVVDTNVLSLSDNEKDPRQGDCLEFLTWLTSDADWHWVLDDNGKMAPAIDTSLLWAEYNDTLSPMGTGMLLFQQMLGAERVCFATRPDQDLRDRIRTLIPRNGRDRVIFGAACNSATRWLVTCDDDDFPADVRDDARRDFGVEVSDPSFRRAQPS